MTHESSYWTTLSTDWGELWLCATERGLCGVAFGAEAPPSEIDRLARYGIAAPEAGNLPLLREARAQLAGYFAGRRTAFDLPLDLRGTDFQRAVWEALLAIPYGETRAYGDIAAAIGRPRAARPVGQAVGANPVGVIVPCHRVIGSDGRLTGFGGGLDLKRALLRLEGVSD
ncbi:MAG: methylated-DNA--[protein]-cysteine S-methyltransferase [Anaerolineales bacterium]